MVPVAGPRLTRIGFRRDIKFFLAALVGFLIIVILALVLLLQTTIDAAAREFRARWELAATAASEAIDVAPPGADPESLLIFARGRFAIDGAALRTLEGRTIVSGLPATAGNTATLTRSGTRGTLSFTFDASPLQELRRKFLLTAAICVAAALIGALLLFFYLPKITRPIEQMLDEASSLGERAENIDEAHYLIETFKSSITTLKAQETELKRLHDIEKSRADELQLITATLTRSLTSGFVAIDAEGRIVDLNSSAREILRLRGEDYSGMPIADAFGEQPFSAHLLHALEERRTVSRQEVSYATGAEHVIVGLTTVPLVGEGEAFLGAIALFADLTHVRSLEARVREMQTLADLGEISAGIAHEFRNSLSTILGYLKLARREPLPEDAGKRVRNAEEEAAELSRAVEGLLSFARPMHGEFQPADLAELVRETAERLERNTGGIRFDLDLEPVQIAADRALLARAIENLLRNSIEAIGQKPEPTGTISVRTRANPSPTLQIEDDGVGLAAEDAPRLMLPFQSDRASGLGLGLPLARKIALLHGGTLRLSGDPGRGATATIDFFDNRSLALAGSGDPIPAPGLSQIRPS